jgi:adenylate kinase
MQTYLICLFILFLPLTLLADKINSAKQVIIILGAPASGKGTQSLRVSEALKLPHISTGDLFRENIAKQTPIGKKVKDIMDAGKLVPDEIVLSMFFDRVAQPDAARGYILDGFPRTISQAEALDKHLSDDANLKVLNLDVSDDTIIKRTLGRKRSDDTPEVVKERLQAYHNQTAPLVEYYADKGVLRNIDGEKSPDEVFRELMQALK